MQLLCVAIEEFSYKEFFFFSYKDYQISKFIHTYGNIFLMPFIYADNSKQINS